ncbi:MAG: phage tail protein, partial [Microcoleaceae cyanobacterium]
MVSTFRGMLYYAGGQVVFTIDKNDQPAFEFTQADVIDGLFTYSSSSNRVKNSIAMVSWSDPNNYDQKEVEIYEDYDLIYEIGPKTIEIPAFGCRSRSLAQRIARWTLLTEKQQGETVTFTTGAQGANCFPAAIINIYDSYKSGVRAGGRLLNIVYTTSDTKFYADNMAVVGASSTISYVNSLGVLETKFISVADYVNKFYQVNGNLSNLPDSGEIFAVAWNTLKPQPYRIISVNENTEDSTYTIIALKHDSNKYAEIEQGISFPEPITSLVSSKKPPSPTLLNIRPWFTDNLGAESDSRVTVSWAGVDYNSLVGYQLELQTSSEGYYQVYEGPELSWSSDKLQSTTSQELKARVRAYDSLGRVSNWTESSIFNLVGDTAVPTAPVNLLFRNSGKVTELSWVNPNLTDYKHTEIYIN